MKITIYQKVQTVIQVEFPDDDAANSVAQRPTPAQDTYQKLFEKMQQEQRYGRTPQLAKKIWKEEKYVALLP